MNKMLEFNIVPYYRYLLERPVPFNTNCISDCVMKGWLHHLGNELGFSAMRLYLLEDNCGSMMSVQIYGNKEFWKDFDIKNLRKERTSYEHLFFVKIRHIRENGQFLTLGYLSFYSLKYVSREMLDMLDVLCMLYGNYIIKRLVQGKQNVADKYLSKAFTISASPELPGTKIKGVIDCLKKLSSFNVGLYCTCCNCEVQPEYVVSSKGASVLRKCRKWNFPFSLIDEIKTCYGIYSRNLGEMPLLLIKFLLYKDKRNAYDFTVNIYPVYVDAELVGLWICTFSINNPYNHFSIKNFLDNIYPLLFDSYKFLFQRRFQKMVVNPIFNNRDTRVDRGSVFIIMPFTEAWSDDVWKQVLQPAIKEINMVPVRADDLYGRNIMEDVWQGILKAEIIICDTTGRNPNVFYELGIAHTLGKKVLLLTQDLNDIPFDLQAYRHIKYDVTITGGNILKDNIKLYIQETLKQK